MTVAVAPRRVRRLVAIHEAGRAAMSLVLGQGHQEGVSILCTGEFGGFHAVGDQPDLTRLPRPLALREGVKQALVTLAGPIAEAKTQGDLFDVGEFLSEADDPLSDASQLMATLDVLERHLSHDAGRAEFLASTATDFLERTDVQDLITAIADALIRRSTIGGEGLARIHDQHPTDPGLQWVPTTLVGSLNSREPSAQPR